MSRAVFARILALLLGLPALGSAPIVLTAPPASALLPPAVVDALRPAAILAHEAVAALPPDSLPGRLFHGSYAPLPAIFGSGALAAHAILLALPWLLLSAGLLRWSCLASRKAPAAQPRPF